MLTDSSGVPFPPIRRLGPDDLTRCVALSVDRAWSPEKAKWSLLLAAAEPFGVDAPDGRGLAGAVVLARYGADLASAGMMLVAARYARRGLGRALMEHLLAQAGSATVTLFATDLGRPLYEKLGFQAIRRSVSFVGRFQPARDNDNKRDAGRVIGGAILPGIKKDDAEKYGSRPATEADMAAILETDKAAFGADRGHLLTRLPGLATGIRVLETAGHGITGYAAAWLPDVTSTVLGPVVAPDAESAKLLIADLAANARTPVRLDLDPDRPDLPGWAHAHGLEPVSRTVVMAHGDYRAAGTPDRLYTPISVALA